MATKPLKLLPGYVQAVEAGVKATEMAEIGSYYTGESTVVLTDGSIWRCRGVGQFIEFNQLPFKTWSLAKAEDFAIRHNDHSVVPGKPYLDNLKKGDFVCVVISIQSTPRIKTHNFVFATIERVHPDEPILGIIHETTDVFKSLTPGLKHGDELYFDQSNIVTMGWW